MVVNHLEDIPRAHRSKEISKEVTKVCEGCCSRNEPHSIKPSIAETGVATDLFLKEITLSYNYRKDAPSSLSNRRAVQGQNEAGVIL